MNSVLYSVVCSTLPLIFVSSSAWAQGLGEDCSGTLVCSGLVCDSTRSDPICVRSEHAVCSNDNECARGATCSGTCQCQPPYYSSSRSDGLCAKRVPVGFYARVLDSDTTYGRDQTILFNDVVTNEGGTYNSISGKVNIDVAGLYFFHVSLAGCANDNRRVFIGELLVDGISLGLARTVYKANHPLVGSCQAVLSLNKGQVVWVQNLRDNSAYCDEYSTFSGILITPFV